MVNHNYNIMNGHVPLTLSLVVIASSVFQVSFGQSGTTTVGFYSNSCPTVESIVESTVQSHFRSDPTVAAGLLRLHFHDCFVQGCDASILIDGPGTEKTAGPNLLLHGYDVIDDAKQQLEAECPGIVSCADILTLAARDAVVAAGGIRWEVPTGRRDGRVSLGSDTTELPGFSESVDVQKRKFQDKNLTTEDLVTLVGGHTIGTAACQVFRYRLYDFNSTGGPDPSIDPGFLPTLRSRCPEGGDSSRRVALDEGSENQFDTSFYANLRDGRGVIESDQFLWSDSTTQPIVQQYLGVRGLLSLTFGVEFGRSMVKMGNIELKTGSQGEIRRVCSAIN